MIHQCTHPWRTAPAHAVSTIPWLRGHPRPRDWRLEVKRRNSTHCRGTVCFRETERSHSRARLRRGAILESSRANRELQPKQRAVSQIHRQFDGATLSCILHLLASLDATDVTCKGLVAECSGAAMMSGCETLTIGQATMLYDMHC